jgi:short-subunit dehydrogenase
MKNIIIYGGTSLISIELIKKFNLETDTFFIVGRNKKKFNKVSQVLSNDILCKINFYELDILNITQNIDFINKLETNSIDGVFFLIGETGNPEIEFSNYSECLTNYNTNLINPIIIINNLSMKLKNNSFLCVFTSMSGLRGRALRLFYCSAKAGLISYLSGLRQKLFKRNIQVLNVIAGYMSTEKFNYKANRFLINSPNEVANKVANGIKKKKENIYTSNLWFFIAIVLKILPEKIFKRLNF